MIWVTVSSSSYFCWLYRASPSLAPRNIINLILVLTIWGCPCVESSLVMLEKVLWPICCPASLCTSNPNLPVIPGISWLPTFALQYPMMKGTFFFILVLILEGIVGHHRTIQLQLLQHQWLGHSLGLLWLLNKHIVTMDYCSLIRVFSWNLFIKYRKKRLGCAAVRMEVYWEIFQSMSLSLEWDLTP